MTDLEPIEQHLRAGEELEPNFHVVVRGWPLTVDGMLRNADALASSLLDAGFELLATFAAPHYRIVLPAYDGLQVLGEVKRNPHFVGRQQ